jgi:hypothetical protein
VFGAPAAADAQHATQTINVNPTSAAYLSPNQEAHSAAAGGYPSGNIAAPKGKSNKAKWILGSLAVILLLALVSLIGLVMAVRNAIESNRRTIKIVRPMEPPPPVVPPPPNPTNGNAAVITGMHDLIYPGAEVLMEANNGTEGTVLQLRTKDSFEKVADWYTTKLNPTERVRIPFGGQQAVLKGDKATAVISTATGQTMIILTQKTNQDENP